MPSVSYVIIYGLFNENFCSSDCCVSSKGQQNPVRQQIVTAPLRFRAFVINT